MAKPHATSALGGQDEVGQLTQPFFLFISPQDCDLRTPVSRGAGKRQDAPGRCPAVWSVSAAVGTTPARQGIQRKDHCQGKGDKGKEMREDVAAATCRHKSLALLVTSLISY